MAVGAAPDVANKSDVFRPPQEPCLSDFFETPNDLVTRMIDEAGLSPHHDVLEPSAGEGAIAIPVFEIVHRHLRCIEAHPERAAYLKWCMSPAQVEEGDFLQTTPSAVYDRALMNPPFSNGVDALHVSHALRFLAPGGRPVAIMSAGISFRSDHASKALREKIADYGGTITQLPPNTFKSSGTTEKAATSASSASRQLSGVVGSIPAQQRWRC